jgi:hypothetical protein
MKDEDRQFECKQKGPMDKTERDAVDSNHEVFDPQKLDEALRNYAHFT